MITFTKDLVEFKALSLDCSNSLVPNPSFTNPAPILFDPIGTPVVLINGYADLFTHTFPTNCVL